MPRGVDRWDEARLQGRLWTPNPVDLAAWYDAADISTLTVNASNQVTSWADKSANRGSVASVSGFSNPLYGNGGATTINGMPCVYATGSGFRLGGSVPSNTGTTLSIFLVALNVSGSGRIVSVANGQSGADWNTTSAATVQFTNQTVETYRNSGGLTGALPSYSQATLISVVYTGSNRFIYINGKQAATSASTGSFNCNYLNVTGNAANESINGRLGEALVIYGTPNRARYESYLAWKWLKSGPNVQAFLADTPAITGG